MPSPEIYLSIYLQSIFLFIFASRPRAACFDAGDAATARACGHRPIESADSLSEQGPVREHEYGEYGEHDNCEHEEHAHDHEHGEHGQPAAYQHVEHEQHKKRAEHQSGRARGARRIS